MSQEKSKYYLMFFWLVKAYILDILFPVKSSGNATRFIYYILLNNMNRGRGMFGHFSIAFLGNLIAAD
jgi:hypothetical protein